MKRFDFTKKHNICAVCFVIVMVLTCILCYTLPVVHAEEALTLSDFYHIDEFLDKSTASSLNGTSGYYDVPSGIFASDSQLIYDSPMDYYEAIKSIFEDPDVVTLFDQTYAFWRQSGTTNAISDITFCHNSDGTFSLMLNGDYVSVDYDNQQNYKFRNPSSYHGSTIYRFDWNGSKLVYNTYYDGGTYTNCQNIDGYIASTSAIMMYYPNYQQNLNYLLIDGKCGKGSGGISGITPPYPDESSDNNLFMKDTDFIFTHQTYYAPYSASINTGSAVPVGTVTFKGQPNDYMIQHPSEFSLVLDFGFIYDVDYKNQTGNVVGYFKKTSPTWENDKNLLLGFEHQGITIPLSTFINNNNTQSYAISDIFSNLKSTDNVSLSGVLAQSKEITELSYNNFKFLCQAYIISNGKKSGNYSEWYNFNSKKGYTTDTSINDNSNPYVPNPSEQADDDPDSTNIQPTPKVPGPGGSDDGGNTSNNTTTTNGNGSIVINNNPTFNNNPSASASGGGSSGGSAPNESALNFYTIFNPVSFFTNLLVDKNKATASNLQEATGINAWFQIVNQTYTFIPQQVWTILLACLGAFISITLIAFIIRIILDLL